jgi:hypothetical protein
MTEHGILFSAAMVQAILDNRKSQTRRVIVPQIEQPQPGAYFDAYNHTAEWVWWLPDNRVYNPVGAGRRCPYGTVGDTLWLRETWGIVDLWLRPERAVSEFNADGEVAAYIGKIPGTYDISTLKEHLVYRADNDRPFFWRPSIHMPRWASRITLRITDVRVEQVQHISSEDARAEGSYLATDPDDERGFVNLWDSINAKGYSWATNPFVWAISFVREDA